MSYRAFKHLLGETSLERKCRFLFGGFIVLLITASFWLYLHMTESLVDAMQGGSISPEEIGSRIHWNRALLISTALVTALLIMSGSYLIVRYVIVKPVKHLKEVSDAISAGELNVRSEIQTGDEFEDLSHAFNRMLRNLVSMQDRLRKVNADLDRKVDELAQANMALYESNRLKGDFLATISHELRTPLNSILGFSEVLQSSNQLTEKQQRWVRNIQTSGEQLLSLINDILDLAKIEAGKMQVQPDRVQHLRHVRRIANHVSAAGREEEYRHPQQPGAGYPCACARTWSSCGRFSRTCFPMPSSSRPREAGCCSRWSLTAST